jgi:hypothetical protein
LDPPKDDPTLALITAIEDLMGRSKLLGAEAAAEISSLAGKKFKPARIHYRRGEV